MGYGVSGKMDYVKLGRSGLKVSRLCLGTAFRGYWNGHTDAETARETIYRAVEGGINFIAVSYTHLTLPTTPYV